MAAQDYTYYVAGTKVPESVCVCLCVHTCTYGILCYERLTGLLSSEVRHQHKVVRVTG